MDYGRKKEVRNTAFQVQLTGECEEKRTVEGYALLFGVASDGLSFEEVIERGALEGVIAQSDVFALMNHSENRGILARSKYGEGSLVLTVDEKGLKYRFEAPKTALGEELLENIRRGEVSESSFCFDVEKIHGKRKRTVPGNVLYIKSVICTIFLRCTMRHTVRLRYT